MSTSDGTNPNTAGAQAIFGSVVTTNYFTVLGVLPAAGRLFGAADSEQLGASPIVVLGHGFWNRRFNRDPAIIVCVFATRATVHARRVDCRPHDARAARGERHPRAGGNDGSEAADPD